MSDIRVIPYTDAHQAISILHSAVCIPARYWLNGTEPKEGDEFLLKVQTPKNSDEKFPQTSKWKIEGPVGKIKKLDPGCVSFFRSIWPFKDGWINLNDTLFCFKAKLLEPQIQYIELARNVGIELLEFKNRKKG